MLSIQGYFYTLELTEETDLNEIMLHFGNRNFDWRVKLEGSHTQKEWFKVLEGYRILSIQAPCPSPEYDIAMFEDKTPQQLAALTLGYEELLSEYLPAQSPLFGNKL